jgi:hypothetical protein
LFDVDFDTQLIQTGGKWNLASRNRYNLVQTKDSETSVEFILSLPLGAELPVGAIGIVRADRLIGQGFFNITISRATTFSGTYTTEQTLDIEAAELMGPLDFDLVSTFTASSSYQFWKINFARDSGSEGFSVRPLFLGVPFIPSQSPAKWEMRVTDELVGEAATIGGAHIATRNGDKRHEFSVTWEGLTDAEVETLNADYFQRSNRETFMLYTDTNHGILNDYRMLHAQIAEASTELVYANWNRVAIRFEEVLG